MDLPIGYQLDVLVIKEVLGKGAFGVTYLVEDTILLQPKVLKEYYPSSWAQRSESLQVLPATGKEQSFNRGLASFLDEGRRLATLDHPNIVKIERCFTSNGSAYLLMPFYEGKTLAEMLQDGGLFNYQETMFLVSPLLDALAYLEKRDIVHRDIKPANIYVTKGSVPKLLDFGAARGGLKHENGGDQLFGSGGYAAIEQMDRTYDSGPWTDVYGFSATLYRLITGEIPVLASERLQALNSGKPDPLIPLKQQNIQGFKSGFLDAVTDGLRLLPQDRPSTVSRWAGQFTPPKKSTPGRVVDDERDTVGRWLTIGIALMLLAGFGYFLTIGNVNRPAVNAPSSLKAPDKTPDQAPDQSPVQKKPVDSRDKQEIERAWKRTISLDSIEEYSSFLARYPGSKHAASARARLADLEQQFFNEAMSAEDPELLRAYIAQFPDGAFLIEARTRLEVLERAEQEKQRQKEQQIARDNDAWKTAKRVRTIASVDDYLKAFPQGLYLEEARQLRNELVSAEQDKSAFVSARKLNTRRGYQAYLGKWPQGQFVARALEKIEALTLRPGKVFRDCTLCPSMVGIKAGRYQQGVSEGDEDAGRNEKPARAVSIPEVFAVGVHEVTFDQWRACSKAGACKKQSDDGGWGRGSRPVIGVSWQDAQTYVDWLSAKTGYRYRLPSESEWEYVARAGEKGAWQGGSQDKLCVYSNGAASDSPFPQAFKSCKDGVSLGTAPVGSYKKNRFGLHDTVGNVAEWVQDCMNISYLDAPADGSAWERGLCRKRVVRGGSWFTGLRDMRLSARMNQESMAANDYTGFRVVREAKES